MASTSTAPSLTPSRGHGSHHALEKLAMKTERFEAHREATKALVLSVAGVMVAMRAWIFLMMLLYF